MPPNYKNIAKSGLALIFGLFMMLSACIPEAENPTIELIESSQLAQVRDWFEANKTKLRLPERGTNYRTESQELILPFFEKEPDWEQFHDYYFPDGREVFETSLENANNYFPSELAEIFSGQNPGEIIIQNIMFVRHATRDQFNVVIARYYPGDEESKIDFDEISYHQIPVFWTGKVELFTYDERFFVGFEFEEGEMISSYTRQIHHGEKRTNQAGMDVRCMTRYIPVYYTLCVSQEGFPPSCSRQIDYFVSQISCFGADGGRPSYSFMAGGDPREDDPNTDGGGKDNTDPTPPEVPKPKTRDEIKIKLDKCHKDLIEQLFGASTKEVNKIIRKFQPDEKSQNTSSLEYNVNFVYGSCATPGVPACTKGKIENGFIKVTIVKDRVANVTEFGLATMMLHELLHAYLVWETESNENSEYNELLNRMYTKYELPNPAHHNAFVEANFIDIIAQGLKDYAVDLGYNLNWMPGTYFEDLAWMGLQGTNVFKNKSQEDLKRMRNVWNLEIKGEINAYSNRIECN